MIGPGQIWRRRNPVGGDDLFDEIRTVGTFESEITFTSNIGFTAVEAAIAESIIEHYIRVDPEGPADPVIAPWQTPVRALARHA